MAACVSRGPAGPHRQLPALPRPTLPGPRFVWDSGRGGPHRGQAKPQGGTRFSRTFPSVGRNTGWEMLRRNRPVRLGSGGRRHDLEADGTSTPTRDARRLCGLAQPPRPAWAPPPLRGGTPAPAVSAVVSTRPVGVQDVLGHAPDTRRHPLGTACGCCCCNATYISVLIITITAVTSQPGPEEIHKPELVSTHVQMGTQRLPCPLRPQCLSTPSPSSTHTLTLKSILGDSLGDAALSRIPFSPRVLRCLRNPGGPGFERTTRKARGKSTDTVPGSSPCAERVKVVWPWSLVLPRSV